jgi:hypothetical protein
MPKINSHLAPLFTKDGGSILVWRVAGRAVDLSISNGTVYYLATFIIGWFTEPLATWVAILLPYAAMGVGGVGGILVDHYGHQSTYSDREPLGRHTRWTNLTFYIMRLGIGVVGLLLFMLLYELLGVAFYICTPTLALGNWVATHAWYDALFSGREENLPKLVRYIRRWVVDLKNKPRSTLRKLRRGLFKRVRKV